MKKRAEFAILGLSTGIYFTVGFYGLFIYYVFLSRKLNYRESLLESENLAAIPPYPRAFHFGLYVLVIAYIVLGFILVCLCLNQLRFVNYPLMSLGLLVILAYCGHLAAKESLIYWESTPAMSKNKAIQYAIKKNESSHSRIFKSIYWDKFNHYWIVRFSNADDTSCDTVVISRLWTRNESCKDIY